MKIFKKERLPNGRRHIYFCGIKIASYHRKTEQQYVSQINGKNNKIDIPQDSGIKVSIYGNNNTIIVGKHKYLDNFIITIGVPGCPCDNCKIIIGDDFSCNGASMLLLEDNTVIEIGNDCMFSEQIMLWPSDTHTMIDSKEKVTNIGRFIKFGNHVWVGFGATILKNTIIPDNCIIGTRSVVVGKFEKTNCVIAGNPGRIVKESINWDRRRPKQYIMDKK